MGINKMSMIIATHKAWAASAYIQSFGSVEEEVKPVEPVKPTFFDNSVVYAIPSFKTSLKIGNNVYTLFKNQFHFDIMKNDVIGWPCGTEPTSEFDELVNVSLPLWDEYSGSKRFYLDKWHRSMLAALANNIDFVFVDQEKDCKLAEQSKKIVEWIREKAKT